MKYRLIVTAIAFLFLIICYAYADTGQPVASSSLPTIMISYQWFCIKNSEFKCIWADNTNSLIKIDKSIRALDLQIPLRLAFTHEAFLVQVDGARQKYGYSPNDGNDLPDSKIPYESCIFVTTPLASMDNRILCLLSSVSPERLTIFSIDNRLNCKSLFDSLKYKLVENDRIGSIYSIKVVNSSCFIMEERYSPQLHGDFEEGRKRSYMLNIVDGEIKLLYIDEEARNKIEAQH